MFSIDPRCHGLPASQKYTLAPVARVISRCRAISLPRSRVMVRSSVSGRPASSRSSPSRSSKESDRDRWMSSTKRVWPKLHLCRIDYWKPPRRYWIPFQPSSTQPIPGGGACIRALRLSGAMAVAWSARSAHTPACPMSRAGTDTRWAHDPTTYTAKRYRPPRIAQVIA